MGMGQEKLNAFKKLANFGLGQALDAEIEEQRQVEATETLNKQFNGLTPGTAVLTDTNPNEMMAFTKAESSTGILSNIDTKLRQVTNSATQYAQADPMTYNTQLARDLLPVKEAIDGLKGPDKTVAMRRFTDNLTVAQSTQMKANADLTKRKVQNQLMNNVDASITTALNLPDSVNISAEFDDSVDKWVAARIADGLDPMDGMKAIERVMLGRISSGGKKYISLIGMIKKSKYLEQIDPESLRIAEERGLAKYTTKIQAQNNGALLTKSKQVEHFNNLMTDFVNSSERDKSDAAFMRKNAKYIIGMSPAAFNATIEPGVGELILNGKPEHDSEVNANRQQFIERLAILRDEGMTVQQLRNRFKDGDYDSVVASMETGEDPWKRYDYLQEKRLHEVDLKDIDWAVRRSKHVDEARGMLLDYMSAGGQDNAFLGAMSKAGRGIEKFGDFIGVGQEEATIKGVNAGLYEQVENGAYDLDINNAMTRYSRIKKGFNPADEDQMNAMMTTMFKVHNIGGEVRLIPKNEPSFGDTLEGHKFNKATNVLGTDIRKQLVAGGYISQEDEANFENLVGQEGELSLVTLKGNGRASISLGKYQNSIDRFTGKKTRFAPAVYYKWEPEFTYDYEGKKIKNEKFGQLSVLPKGMADTARKQDADGRNLLRDQLEDEGWMIAPTGDIEFDVNTLEEYTREQTRAEVRAKRKEGETLVQTQERLKKDKEDRMKMASAMMF